MEESAVLDESQLAEFANKLNAWASTLSEQERQFLNQILADATFAASGDSSGYADIETGDDDVQGFAMDGGSSLLPSVFEYGDAISRAEREAVEISSIAG